MLHSVPAVAGNAGCEAAARRPHERLRGHVFGYGAFRSATGRSTRHRLLPVSATVLILDFDAPGLVTGPRATATTDGPTRWGHGVTVGLTPAGVTALLGVPMPELAGRTVALPDLLGARAGELAERLAARADWAGRFALLDEVLATWSPPGPGDRKDPVIAAWRRLQRSGGRLRIGTLAADLGVGRRGLERAFRERFGQSPGAVGRIARLQRAVALIGRGSPLATVAAESGYADQPHLTREARALTGLTPAELRPFLAHGTLAEAAAAVKAG